MAALYTPIVSMIGRRLLTVVSCGLLLAFVGATALAQVPTAATGAATGVSSTGATSNGTVNVHGHSTTVAFEYGMDASYGYTWSAAQSPVSGSLDAPVTAAVTGLASNTAYHYRVVVVNASGGTAYGADMTFTTLSGPIISLNRDALHYGSVQGGVSTGPQNLLVNNSGGGTLDWTVSESQTWIDASPSSGGGASTITVTVDPSGLSVGTHTGLIIVSDPEAFNSPQTVNVSLTVYGIGTTSAPFGAFETPVDGSTVRSSIPVTGWALDDIGVQRVRIWRAPLAGEGGGLLYIGDAVFVEGGRPDVELAYPGYPYNYRAAWGYTLLTNFLPNGGNGTYTLHAVATDLEGHQVTLGTKTITVDNANALKPFGSIDTPPPGGTAFGNRFVVHGWVLTPQPNYIPTDGSTITVWVDGVRLGHPTYNMYRPDIAGLFPGYANSNGAGCYFYLDTTKYPNGVHTILMTAEDSAGNKDGIGSRYFTILNLGGGSPAPEINVRNGGDILDGGDYDFGTKPIGSDTDIIFTITNTGTDILTLTTPLALGGADAGEFSIQAEPALSVVPFGITTFVIRFSPASAGNKTSTVAIASNDSDENPYDFAIRGIGIATPEIDVQGKGASIADGDTTPSTADDTDFGSADVTTGVVEHTFAIRNTGTASLNLPGTPRVLISGAHAGDFAVSVQPTSPVASGGGTTTFTVRFDPGAVGLRTATISIANNDADENPYDFMVQGTGIMSGDINGDGAIDLIDALMLYRYTRGVLTLTSAQLANADVDEDGDVDMDDAEALADIVFGI